MKTENQVMNFIPQVSTCKRKDAVDPFPINHNMTTKQTMKTQSKNRRNDQEGKQLKRAD